MRTDQVLPVELLNDLDDPVDIEETAWFITPAALLGNYQ